MRVAAIVAVGVAAAVAVAVVGIALGGGGGGGASKTQYQATVVNARNRVDYALFRITKSQSVDELIQRLNYASTEVGSAAGELDRANVAKGFESQNAQLAATLHSFSTELANTAETFKDPTFSAALENANSLSFPEWDTANRILTKMKAKGIQVRLLARH